MPVLRTAAAAAAAAALARSALACYGPGERNEGAPGMPYVPYAPCCDGRAAAPRAGDWGKFCPGGGGGGLALTAEPCAGAGEKNQGAPGYPPVDYKPCCDGAQAEEREGDWGKFCPGGGGGGGKGYPDEARLYGISFSPFGLGSDQTCLPYTETPGDSICLSKEKVRSDLDIIRTYTKRIKTYSLLCEEATVEALKFARETGMTVMLGIWIQQDAATNDVEIEKLARVMADYGDVVTEIMVGNEPVYILEVKEARLARYITRVKAVNDALPEGKRAQGGVGTADIYPAWIEGCTNGDTVRDDFDMQAIVDASDWIGLNGHSFYGGTAAEDAPTATLNGAAQISQKYGGKRVIVTETGYPAGGPSFTPPDSPECPAFTKTTAVPSVQAMSTFMAGMEKLTRERGIEWYMFEPFDSLWKTRWEADNNAGETDSNWGLATCDRKMKPGLVLPPPGAL